MPSLHGIKGNVQPGNFQNGFLSRMSRRMQGIVAGVGSNTDIGMLTKLATSVKTISVNSNMVNKVGAPTLTNPLGNIFYITCGISEMGGQDVCQKSESSPV